MKNSDFQNLLHADTELYKSEKNLENLDLICQFHQMYKKGFINETEFEDAKYHVMYSCNIFWFVKSTYENHYMAVIPLLHKLLESKKITESQYHEAIPLVIKAERRMTLASYLLAGLINMNEFISPEKSKLLNWMGKRTLANMHYSAGTIALELFEEYGFSVVIYEISFFRTRLTIKMKKGNSDFEVRQHLSLLGSYKSYIIDENKKKYSYNEFMKRLKATKN